RVVLGLDHLQLVHARGEGAGGGELDAAEDHGAPVEDFPLVELRLAGLRLLLRLLQAGGAPRLPARPGATAAHAPELHAGLGKPRSMRIRRNASAGKAATVKRYCMPPGHGESMVR